MSPKYLNILLSGGHMHRWHGCVNLGHLNSYFSGLELNFRNFHLDVVTGRSIINMRSSSVSTGQQFSLGLRGLNLLDAVIEERKDWVSSLVGIGAWATELPLSDVRILNVAWNTFLLAEAEVDEANTAN